MIHRDFRISLPGDEWIRGEARIPRGAPPRSAVVLLHGFRAFRSWSFLPWLARQLAASGYAAVTFDFSRNGVGPDPGRFSELKAFAGNTVSREVREVGWVLDRVLDGEVIPRTPDRVALLGHGRGGSDAVPPTTQGSTPW